MDQRTEDDRGIVIRAAAAIGPDFALVILFTMALAVLIVVYGGSFTSLKEGQVLISAGILVGFVAVRFLWRAPFIIANRGTARADFRVATRQIARDWGPFVIMMWLFQSLETYVGKVRAGNIDDYLYRADLALFGVEPSVWLSHYSTPLLTDYMALAYGLYFITPMIVAVMLSIRGLRSDFREMCTALVLQLGIAFILFLIFPAASPRYYAPLLNGVFDPAQLQSMTGLYELQQTTFATADPLRELAAFPSLHCSLGWLTLTYSRRFSNVIFPRFPRLWYRIVLPAVISLWISTIYLRHHWVVDIFAGIALGMFANWLAPILRQRWPHAVRSSTA